MNKLTIITIILTTLMIASFITSMVFFTSSNMINFETGELNELNLKNIENYVLEAISFQNIAMDKCDDPNSPECKKLLDGMNEQYPELDVCNNPESPECIELTNQLKGE